MAFAALSAGVTNISATAFAAVSAFPAAVAASCAALSAVLAIPFTLFFSAEIVDSDYSGEIHLGIANFTDEPTKVCTGQKLIQFIHTPVILSKPREISEVSFNAYHMSSTRGDKGFGSNVNTATK